MCDVQGEGLLPTYTPLPEGKSKAATLPSLLLKGKGLIYLLGEIQRGAQTYVATADTL